MTPRSGIAVFVAAPIGLLRMDDSGLRIVSAFDQDPKTFPKLEAAAAAAFDLVDGHHVTVREAMAKLPEALGIPAEWITDLVVTDEEELPELPEDAIS